MNELGHMTAPVTETLHQRPTPRMLDIAEQIGTLIEANIWTNQTFPTSAELERRFHTRQGTIRGALLVNVARGQVRYYADPDSGNARARYLPSPSSELPVTGPHRVAMVVTTRIASGQWTADNFPTTREIARELRCGHDTVDAGMKIAEARGVIRKVQVLTPPPGRGRKWVWRPASVVVHEPSVYDRLLADIRAGTLVGQLPFIKQMGRQLRVNPQAVADAYRRLTAEGHIHRVTVRRGAQGHLWHVLDGSEPYGRPRQRRHVAVTR